MELKKGYKQTEVGVIPEDWDVKDVKQIAPFQRGFDLPTRFIIKGQFPIVYSNGIEGYHNRFMVRGPGVATGRSGTLGKVHYVENDYWPHNTSLWVTKFNGNLPKYIYYLYTALHIERFASGSGVPTLNRNDVHSYRVALPPNEKEQRAIASALSDVDALLESLVRLIAKKRDIKQAAMQQLLTGKKRLPGFEGEWEETTLGEIGGCVIGLTYKPENIVKHGLLVLRSSNIQNGCLSYEDNVYVNVDVPDHLVTRVGDILVCVRNGSRALIGKCAVIDEHAAGLTFGAFMSIYRTKYWQFVAHAFKSDNIQKQIMDNIGATINQITNKDMNAFRLKLPPEDEQLAIAKILTDMDSEIAALEKRREKTKSIKQAMMQELLTGKTRLI